MWNSRMVRSHATTMKTRNSNGRTHAAFSAFDMLPEPFGSATFAPSRLGPEAAKLTRWINTVQPVNSTFAGRRGPCPHPPPSCPTCPRRPRAGAGDKERGWPGQARRVLQGATLAYQPPLRSKRRNPCDDAALPGRLAPRNDASVRCRTPDTAAHQTASRADGASLSALSLPNAAVDFPVNAASTSATMWARRSSRASFDSRSRPKITLSVALLER